MAKQITRTITTKSDEVFEVKTLWEEDEANKLLASKKWILLHGCVAHKDHGGYQAKPCWLLGRIEN